MSDTWGTGLGKGDVLPDWQGTQKRLEDRAGAGVGNGDMIMVLLSQKPDRSWKQVKVRETLKLSDETNSMSLSDSWGAGVGNGYRAGDQAKYDAALRAAGDRIGNG